MKFNILLIYQYIINIKIENKFDKKEVTIMRGIGVHWWSASNKVETFRFHSNELVPKSVAEKGEEAVIEYFKNNNNGK